MTVKYMLSVEQSQVKFNDEGTDIIDEDRLYSFELDMADTEEASDRMMNLVADLVEKLGYERLLQIAKSEGVRREDEE